MKRVPKHRRWQIEEAKASNYVGLNEDERAWLENFNDQEIDDDFSNSSADPEFRRICYRRSYRQRFDAQNIAICCNGIRGVAFDPLESIIAIIDATSRARSVRTFRKFRLLVNPNFLPKKESIDGRSTVDREPVIPAPKRRRG
jgi:hypothetical protein